jgi:hypothetical protein
MKEANGGDSRYTATTVLTKRDELSFLTVFALPNASKIGFA